MLCHDFFIVMNVYALSKLLRLWFVMIIHRLCFVMIIHRLWFVKTSSFMICQYLIVYDLSWFLHRNERTCFVKVSSYMFCRNFFIVYALSWSFIVYDLSKLLRLWFVMISSSYMNFHDFFIVHVLSWFLHRNERKCFVKVSSFMFCHDFFIVMSVHVLSWSFIVYALSNMNVYALSKLHRTCFVETKHICFVMIIHRLWFVMISSS